MTIRKSIFWLHLGSGLVAGLVVAIMSATGVAIAFEAEILQWIDRDVRTVSAPANATVLTLDQLDAAVKQQRPDLKVTSRTVPRETDRAYEFRAGREGVVYVNQYTGAVADPTSKGAHDFLHVLQDWHRRLGMEGDNRELGKLLTGIANLAFLFMCISGVYMWWPRSWSPRAWRPAVWFVGGIRGRARDFNWHNVFGSWSAIVLIVIVTGGVMISFTWANRLIYTLAGEEPPQRGAAQATPQATVPLPEPGQEKLSRDAVLARVVSDFPDWQSVAFESAQGPDANKSGSESKPLNLTLLNPAAFQQRGRVQLAVDPYRGDVLSKLAFGDRSAATRARSWLRFLHTGEAFGLPGKVIATIASLASLFLVYTGFALSYRRFFPAKRKVDVQAFAARQEVGSQ